MYPKEEPQDENISSIPPTFTGFVATYEDGNILFEKEDYYSEKLRRPMATSWPEIDRARLICLDLYWRGQKKVTVSKTEQPHITANDWFFSQTGYLDVTRAKHTIMVIARNIGHRGKDGLLYITSVRESDGTIKGSVRA